MTRPETPNLADQLTPAPETHAAPMWQLQMTNAAKEWVDVGTFGTVTEAARRIVELEDTPKNGLFLEFHVDTTAIGTDEEAFRVFHYTGKRALYGISRARAN